MFLHQPSGLYLTPYRAYDPYSGRWLSRDPAGEPGGFNLYGYVREDPVNNVDPDGQAAAIPLPDLGPLAGPLIGIPLGALAGEAICYYNPWLCSPPGSPPPSPNGPQCNANAPPQEPPAPPPPAPPSPGDILMPGGQPIGTPGSRPGYQDVPGGSQEAQDLYDQLTQGGTPSTPPIYPGTGSKLPGGGWVGIRPQSKSGGPAIDVNIPGIPITKIHFY